MSSLASHRVVASEEEEEDEHITEVEVDSDYIAKIKVIQSPGYLCHITASITLKVAPKALYQQVGKQFFYQTTGEARFTLSPNFTSPTVLFAVSGASR